MTSKDYTVRLKGGDEVTIEGVYSVQKDGAGLRFYDEDGNVVAGFDDGSTSAHWDASAEFVDGTVVTDDIE